MDPGTGRLYPSVADARAAGVKNPVELIGRAKDIERISAAVAFGKTLSGRKIDQKITREPSSYEYATLKGLQSMALYQGTVQGNVIASRRVRGKIAKASRKVNRGNR